VKVAVLCEFSGIVRDAFIRKGHDAISCDLLDTEEEGPHIKGDCLEYDWSCYDLLICHPPCTHLAVSGAAHFAAKRKDGRQQQGIDFFMALTKLNCERIAIENPIGIMSRLYRKPDQIVQPWQFGHPESKATCLWLKGVKKLLSTDNVKDLYDKLPKNKQQRLHYLPPSKDRGKIRSITYTGIAEAMAEQWG
jgi:hypothetical protein